MNSIILTDFDQIRADDDHGRIGRIVFSAILILLIAIAALLPKMLSSGCERYFTRAGAQKALEHGKTSLDRDHDGKACESENYVL